MFGTKPIHFSSLHDEELMEWMSKGESKAFETLYGRYFNKLVWFARSFVDDIPHSEDLVQEVFLKLIERPELFDRNKKFSTWIYVVTSNRCKQALRDEKNRLRILEENVLPFKSAFSESHANSDLILLKEKIQMLHNKLSDKERAIYTLRFEQELSIKDIALILELPEGSIKSGIYYLLKKFANHLKEFNHEK